MTVIGGVKFAGRESKSTSLLDLNPYKPFPLTLTLTYTLTPSLKRKGVNIKAKGEGYTKEFSEEFFKNHPAGILQTKLEPAFHPLLQQ